MKKHDVLRMIIIILLVFVLIPLARPADSEKAQKAIYEQSHKEMTEVFNNVKGKVDILSENLTKFQKAIETWRNATTEEAQKRGIKGIDDLVGGLNEAALKKILATGWGQEAVKKLEEIEKTFGIKLSENVNLLQLLKLDPRKAFDYMYNLSAFEKALRQKGIFDYLEKVQRHLKTGEGYLKTAGQMIEFVKLFDPTLTDENSPTGSLKRLGAVLNTAKTFTDKIPAIGKVIDFYVKATEAFSNALDRLDKKIKDARQGSLCGQLGVDKAIQRAFEKECSGCDCLTYLSINEQYPQLSPVRGWQGTEKPSVFLYFDETNHTLLDGGTFAILYEYYAALKSSSHEANTRLVSPERFISRAMAIGNRSISEHDEKFKKYYETFEGEKSYTFRKVLEIAGALKDFKIVSSDGQAEYSLGSRQEEEFRALCFFNDGFRKKVEELIDNYGKHIKISGEVVPKDKGAKITKIEIWIDHEVIRNRQCTDSKCTFEYFVEKNWEFKIWVHAAGFRDFNKKYKVSSEIGNILPTIELESINCKDLLDLCNDFKKKRDDVEAKVKAAQVGYKVETTEDGKTNIIKENSSTPLKTELEDFRGRANPVIEELGRFFSQFQNMPTLMEAYTKLSGSLKTMDEALNAPGAGVNSYDDTINESLGLLRVRGDECLKDCVLCNEDGSVVQGSDNQPVDITKAYDSVKDCIYKTHVLNSYIDDIIEFLKRRENLIKKFKQAKEDGEKALNNAKQLLNDNKTDVVKPIDKEGVKDPGKDDKKDGQKPTPQVQPGSYTQSSGQAGITSGVSGQTGIQSGTSSQAGITSGVSGQAGITAGVSGQAGITSGVSGQTAVQTGITSGASGLTGVQTGITSGVSAGTGVGVTSTPPACVYEYSEWGECNRGSKTQTRTVRGKKPAGCVEKGEPVLQQRCDPPPTEEEKRQNYLNCLCACTPFWQSQPWYGSKECGGRGPCESRTFAYGTQLCSFIRAKPECAASCYKSAYGKTGDPASIEKDIRDTNRKHKEAVKIKLNQDKCPVHAQLGDIIQFSVSYEGGIPPHKVSWSGNGMAKDNTFTFANSRQPGTHPITVTVTDSDGGSATASCAVIVDAITVEIEKTSPPGNTLPMGGKASFRAIVKSGKNQASGELKYQWQPHPEVQFGDDKNPLFETTSPNTTATYTRLGTFPMWVQVLKKMGESSQTIGESKQIPMTIIKPTLKLSVNKKNPRIGETVIITVEENPKMGDDMISFWWEIKGDAANPGPEPNVPNSRAYSFKPKNTNSITVTVHGKAKDKGDDLGQASATVTAQEYEVSIGEPQRRGPKPKIWNPQVWKSPEWKQGQGLQGEGGLTPGGGLIEVSDSQFAVFEDIFVKADVKPIPEKLPLRYDWAIAPSGICGIPGAGQELRLNCSQTGTYTVSLTVRDSENLVLGRASKTVSVTVSQEDLDNAKRPLVTLKADKTTLKTGETTVITAAVQGGKTPYTYQWGTGVEGKGETASFSPKKSGAQKITVEVTDSAGKKNTANISIKVERAKLELTLKPAKTDIKLGETINIKAEAKGGEAPFTYTWSPDAKAKGDSLPYVAKKGGAQTVSVEVTDGARQKAKATVEIKVEVPKLEVTLKADKMTLKMGETAQIQAIVKGGVPPVTSKWGADAVAKGETASFTPKKSGAYKITVTVSDDAKQTANAGIDIKVEPTKLEVSLKADKTTLKLGETATLQAAIKGGEPPLVSRWGSGIEGKGDSGRFVADKPGTHKALLEVSDQAGQKASASVDLKVEVPKLEITLTPDKPTLKVGEKGTIQAKVRGGMPEYTYQWSSFVSGKGETAVFTPTQTGFYKVWLEVRDKMGGKVSASLDWKVEAGHASQTPQVGGVEKIAIEPENLKLALGETQTLQVLRILPDGRKEPYAQGKVSWSGAPSQGIVISDQGKVQATSLAKTGARVKITVNAGSMTADASVEVISSSKTPSTIPSTGTSTAATIVPPSVSQTVSPTSATTGASTTPPGGGPKPAPVAAPLTILIMEPASMTIPPGGKTTFRVFAAEASGKRTDVTNKCTLTVSPDSGIRIDREGGITAEKTARLGAVEPVLATMKHASGATLRADGIIRIEGTATLPSTGYDPKTDPGKPTTIKPEDLDKVKKIAGDFQTGQWKPLDSRDQKIKDQPAGQSQPPEYLGSSTTTTPTTVPPGGTTTPTTTPTTTTTGATSQNLTDVTVDRRDVTITVWDHGTEDGDIITIYLNGKVLKSKLLLTKKKQSFQVKLTGGQNRFEVEAVNEGSTPPNTATVEISNVTKGKPSQVYERKTGQRASMNLTAP